MSSCEWNVNYVLSIGLNITETSKFLLVLIRIWHQINI